MGEPTGHGWGVGASTRIPVGERLTARATTPLTCPGQLTRTSRRKPTRGPVLLPSQPTIVSSPPTLEAPSVKASSPFQNSTGIREHQGFRRFRALNNVGVVTAMANSFSAAEFRRTRHRRGTQSLQPSASCYTSSVRLPAYFRHAAE